MLLSGPRNGTRQRFPAVCLPPLQYSAKYIAPVYFPEGVGRCISCRDFQCSIQKILGPYFLEDRAFQHAKYIFAEMLWRPRERPPATKAQAKLVSPLSAEVSVSKVQCYRLAPKLPGAPDKSGPVHCQTQFFDGTAYQHIVVRYLYFFIVLFIAFVNILW